MNNIKSFIYLDSYKLYSISSQIFEGLTESVIEYTGKEALTSESQKGPIASGKIIGDILKNSEGRKEIKYLYDYAYILFEKALIENEKVNVYGYGDTTSVKVGEKPFIKIKGKIKFKDSKKTINTFKEFNRIGEALSYVTTYSSQGQIKRGIDEKVNSITDRNQKVRVRAKLEAEVKANLRTAMESNGLHMDEKYLEKMAEILEYGYKDAFEIEMPFKMEDNVAIISCLLNREYLRENENLIINKYSRATEREITLFGIETQKYGPKIKSENEKNEGVKSLKQSMSAMTDAIIAVEDNFIGKEENEIIIDPIAIYLEL